MTLAPSKNLERYELLDRIAAGGMAEVFRAKAFGAHGFEKTLAIKRILPELAQDPEFEERFIAEAKLAVELSHANVVQVLDFGRFAGSLFIAMEFVSGLDLAALLQDARDRGEPLPLPVAFQISMELMRGLSFAHQHGVVHRDVSPSNILISRAGEVKIADFGIAVAAGARRHRADEGRIMGKWRYMSPEQSRGEELDTRSDIFSAAVVIYEIFTGEKLFPGESSAEIIENISRMPIPKVADKRPGVPAEVDELLSRALERRRAARTTSATDMLRALTEASYKSSTVATALDVADRVAEAEEHVHSSDGPALGIDALIRAQLAEAADDALTRNTKVAAGADEALATTQLADKAESEQADVTVEAAAGRTATGSGDATVIRRAVDGDGVTVLRLEQHTVAAGPNALRKSGQTPALVEARASRPFSLRWLVAFVVAAGLAVAGLWMAGVFDAASPEEVRAPSPESPAETRARLAVETDPAGATVLLDGKPVEGVTPVEVVVQPDRSISVEIHLEGYKTLTEVTSVPKGGNVRLRPTLTPFSSSLVVRTRPEGATVYLDGKELGKTPHTSVDLRPGAGRKLRIEKSGYYTIEETIHLVRDQTFAKDFVLRSAVRMGRVNINVEDSWAEVYYDGKLLGTTPATFSLPQGTQVLRLVNTQNGKSRTLTVEVGPKSTTYNVAL
jgi:tRNA A-37 threonylcarbamoyl transferase component Bud32